jgi:membrane protease YdiL (CAAX protease family)
VNETKELPEPLTDAEEGAAVEVAVMPPPPPVTPGNLARDAVFDLFSALITGILATLACVLVVALGLLVSGRNVTDMGRMARSPWVIAGLLLATQLPMLYFALRRRRRNREKQRPMMDLFGGPSFSAIPIGVFAGLALTVLSAVYTSILQRLLGPQSVQSQVEFLQDILDNKPAVALLIFLIAGMAPLCEELFFRGVIFGAARAAGLTKVGIAISAILFACAHLSLLLAPFYATFAVVMCWLYMRTGTLAAPMAAHATLNGVACAALVLVRSRV